MPVIKVVVLLQQRTSFLSICRTRKQ